MDEQISLFELLTEKKERNEPEIPAAPQIDDQTDAYRIPERIWETRCRYCIHKNSGRNIPIPKAEVHRPYNERILPCRIMSISRPGGQMPGECFSFAPKDNIYGICATCRHDNVFHEGYCMKEDHAEQRRVFYGKEYSNGKPDYWGRHRLSVCDDYEPAAEDLNRIEETEEEADGRD